jgi:hypothetical protein
MTQYQFPISPDNTNRFGLELYSFQAEMNGTGFPLAYLFLENNGQCGEGIRTSIVQVFLTKLRDEGIHPQFLLTDKDFAQINAARFTWKDIKIQLCKWHIKRAVMARLGSNKAPRNSSFNPLSELGARFPFNGITQAPKFCPKELRQKVWDIMGKHLHQHPLIPTSDGQFLTKTTIQETAIQEMYSFCKQNSLISLWCYLWGEWYTDQRWVLWARSACEDKMSVLKTTMFVEGHWKVIKRDFLYKFFRPRLDLVLYILMTKVVTHQQRKLQQIKSGREKPEWVKQFKSEWKRLSTCPITQTYVTDTHQWICGCPYYLTSRFGICKHLVQAKGAVTSEFFNNVKRNCTPPFLTVDDNQVPAEVQMESISCSNDIENNVEESTENSLETYDELIESTRKALLLLEEQKAAGNVQWLNNIKRNFNPVTQMVQDVERYRRKRTMPLTWKGHTRNTRYLK